jgi:hypothetical protein
MAQFSVGANKAIGHLLKSEMRKTPLFSPDWLIAYRRKPASHVGHLSLP